MTKSKTYYLDGDCLETTLRYDAQADLWIEDYVDFEAVPRYTPNGRLWKSVTTVGCPYAHPVYQDCGTCEMLRKVHPSDLIGVCHHEKPRLRE